MTFFSGFKYHYKDVKVDESNGIETLAFLNACKEIVPFFDVLGSTAFGPVKSDINGNINRLMDKFASAPQNFGTLQTFVHTEQASKTAGKSDSCTNGLLWLKRALGFIKVFLDTVLNGEQDLTACGSKAYEQSLRPYHGWIVRGVFSLAMKACPYRKDFFQALGKGASEEAVLGEIRQFVDGLGPHLATLNAFFKSTGIDTTAKV